MFRQPIVVRFIAACLSVPARLQTAVARVPKRIRAEVIRFQIQRVEAQQRDAVDGLTWAVDMRILAQRYFTEKSKVNAARREALQAELDAITKELP